MPPTRRYQFRFSDDDLAILDKLAHLWGPVASLTRTQVIREAISRAWKAETQKPAARAAKQETRS